MSAVKPSQSLLASKPDNCFTPNEPAASAAPSLTYSDESEVDEEPVTASRERRVSTRLITQSAAEIERITGQTTAQLVSKCCGGGCCGARNTVATADTKCEHVDVPENDAYRSLGLKIDDIPTHLTGLAKLPEQTVFLLPLFKNNATIPRLQTSESGISVSTPKAQLTELDSRTPVVPVEIVSTSTNSVNPTGPLDTPAEMIAAINSIDVAPLTFAATTKAVEPSIKTPTSANEKTAPLALEDLDTSIQPPSFVQPHPPYHVFPARLHNARELTNNGAEKRTYHFDIDVTDYPGEGGVDFRVGGAIGVMAPNDSEFVEELMNLLYIPHAFRDKPVLLKTTNGRWPTVWGDEKPRELVTTRRDLLTWCSDIQSNPPTKPMLRLMAEFAHSPSERKILEYLCSNEGQGTFCEFRTGPHVTVSQILEAFPSAHVPLERLFSVLQPLMPRFYSLSNDPHESFVATKDGKETRRLVEIAVTVHEAHDWKKGVRTGVGSGFFKRQARKYFDGVKAGNPNPVVHIPMFKGLMQNPLAKKFVSDGPMLLIGAGVGIAPFRGFVQRRLKTANCANKVWVLQGIRDSLVDEIYCGEWGVHEDEVKRVVESRRGTGRYVQEEVRAQADLVWYIINSVDGRVFVCGSSRGMGEGVEEALVEIAMKKANLGKQAAQEFWDLRKEAGQYIAETW